MSTYAGGIDLIFRQKIRRLDAMPTPPTARTALNGFGIEAICRDISDGKSLTSIAKSVGTTIGSIVTWLAADPDRSARAHAARRATAWHWDELAEKELREAPSTPEGIAKARELAQHFRWRSSKINWQDYGDKVGLNHSGGVTVTALPYDPAALTDEQRAVMQDVLLTLQPRVTGPD